MDVGLNRDRTPVVHGVIKRKNWIVESTTYSLPKRSL